MLVVDDEGSGDQHFNRHRAYNRGAAMTSADVLCYIESDIMLPFGQLNTAVRMAGMQRGLVVPFSEQHKLGEIDSGRVRGGQDREKFTPEVINHTATNTVNHGCASVISRYSLKAVGQWDEEFDGHGHDDTAMLIAFDRACGPARFVPGVAHHLYHLEMDPGLTSGSHITPEDARAQVRNGERLQLYREAATADQIRKLTSGGIYVRDWRTAGRH